MDKRGIIVKLSNGEEVTVYRVNNDVNGNPRYVVHFLSLGLNDYISIAEHTGYNKYRAKWFGGGYVFSTYRDLKDSLEDAMKNIKKYY